MKHAEEVLATAIHTIHAREYEYGSPAESFRRIAALWSAFLGISINEQDVAMLMILLKIARLENQPEHLDSKVDICGYAALMGEFNND